MGLLVLVLALTLSGEKEEQVFLTLLVAMYFVEKGEAA